MIRNVLLWFAMWFGITCHAQLLVVMDGESNEPLPSVSIIDKDQSVTTDQAGTADITSFQHSETIIFKLVGYSAYVATYEQLKSLGFIVRLTQVATVLDEVVVSSYKTDESRLSSLHIKPIHLSEIEQYGSFSLTDALTRLPGVSQLSTGIGISKPVIRGLYGNRILVLFSGLRFDNQQWQNEHGMGLSDVGISKAEVIKGPLSVLYGTDAMGGVINIIEESPPKVGTNKSDARLDFNSNTLGGTMQVGTKSNFGKKWFRVRLAGTSHSDYSDGNGDRVLNTRFNGRYLKGTYGFLRNNWSSENSYYFSYAKSGFVFNDQSGFGEPDARWNRSMNGPHHQVMLNMLSSDNHFQLPNSELRVNLGIQSNLRSEDEGGGELSLKMHLLTGQYLLNWSKKLKENVFLAIASNSSIESNRNYGRRKIVPNATSVESTLSAYVKHSYNRFITEYGIGFGFRQINAMLTPTVNSFEKEIDPFQQWRIFSNGMYGVSWLPSERWNLKLNLASGVRAPNLAELSSNGLHEGIYTYEVGNPNIHNERNVNFEVGLNYAGNAIEFNISGFYNWFKGYIYIEPSGEEWFGFPVYRYQQQDAAIYGTEASCFFYPNFARNYQLSMMYSGLVGKLGEGDYLPFMPARKIKPELRFDQTMNEKSSLYWFVNLDIILAKRFLSSEELPTPSYLLFNAGIGREWRRGNTLLNLNLVANNILNESYYDHLSRIKNFGLLNIGRNVSMTLKLTFINNLKIKNNEN